MNEIHTDDLIHDEHYWVFVPGLKPRVYWCEVFVEQVLLRNFMFNRNVERLPEGTKIYGPIPKVNNG